MSITSPTFTQIFADHKIILSGGSPAIEYDSKYYIGVGHAKISVKKFQEIFGAQNYLYHPSLIYLAFFYKIDIATHQIVSITQLFIITDNYSNDPYLLQFPSGLQKIESDKFIISYGEADIRCKIFTITRTNIDLLFTQMDYIISTYNKVTKPNILKEICIYLNKK